MAGAENLQRELSAQDPRGAARADREPLPAGDQHPRQDAAPLHRGGSGLRLRLRGQGHPGQGTCLKYIIHFSVGLDKILELNIRLHNHFHL